MSVPKRTPVNPHQWPYGAVVASRATNNFKEDRHGTSRTLGAKRGALLSLSTPVFGPYEERTYWLVWLKLDPRWENLRSDARFEHLMQRVGLAP